MSDEIDGELFDHLANLAALELPTEESEYLRQQLNNQLKAIQELAAIHWMRPPASLHMGCRTRLKTAQRRGRMSGFPV